MLVLRYWSTLAHPRVTSHGPPAANDAPGTDLVQMARHAVSRRNLPQRGLYAGAARHGVRATRMEPATIRWTERGRDLARQNDLLAQLIRTREQHRREEGLGVGMAHVIEQQLGRRVLDDLAQIHDGGLIGHVAHGCEVMRNEQI